MSTQNSMHDRIPSQELYSGPPIAIVVIVLVLLFFFLGFFSLYFCRCFLQNLLYSWHLRHSPTGTPVNAGNQPNNPGIDPKIIQSFPTFPYSSVKDYRKEKYGLECAICLIEFENDDVLRMLTKCCHVFHQECIDLWLEKHKTCPVCRRSLDTILESPEKSPDGGGAAAVVEEGSGERVSSSRHSFCISIKEDEGLGPGPASRAGLRAGPDLRMKQRYVADESKFPRSHSTGHSIVRNREEEDRFTLRLPEHVHAKILRGHNWSKSCTTFGEFRCKGSGSGKERNGGGFGFGEVSGSFPSAPTDNIDRV